MSKLFSRMVSNILADERADRLFIIDGNSTSIEVEVEDRKQKICHRYTITDTDAIDRQWLDSKLVISERLESIIDRAELLDWLMTEIKPEMMMSLDRLLIIANNSEEEFDRLIGQDDRIAEMLTEQCCDLPGDHLWGVEWFSENTPVVNFGAIFESKSEWHEINDTLLRVLAHEIRHLAQSNDYLPAEVLQRKPKTGNDEDANEEDALEYERLVNTRWVLCGLPREKKGEENEQCQKNPGQNQ